MAAELSHRLAHDPQCWGFAQLPSLQGVLHSTTTAQQGRRGESSEHLNPDTESTLLSRLEASRAFGCNACVAAMAEALGIADITASLAGSLMHPPSGAHSAQAATYARSGAGAPALPGQQSPAAAQPSTSHPAAVAHAAKLTTSAAATAAAEDAKEAVRRQINRAWADEAVKRGVCYAKAGDYQQAMGCYDKALELDPSSCDAFVARGAARANQGHFRAAVTDFEAALQHQPGHANATKYLQATMHHMQSAGDETSQDPQHQQRQQLHEQQHEQATPSFNATGVTAGDRGRAGQSQQQQQELHRVRSHDRRRGSSCSPGQRWGGRPLQQARSDASPGGSSEAGHRQYWSRHDSDRSTSPYRGRSRSRDDTTGRAVASADPRQVLRRGGRRHSRHSRSCSHSRSRDRLQDRLHGAQGTWPTAAADSGDSRGNGTDDSSRSRRRRAKRKRPKRGSSSGRSSSSRSSSSSGGSSPSPAQHGTVSDILAAIRTVRSARKASKQYKKSGSKQKHKKGKHKRTHGKHKRKKSKH